MRLARATNPYERFMDPADRDRLVSSLQRRFNKRVGSDEVEDAYGHMLERLTKMPVADVEAIENPAVWMFVGMRNRLGDRLRLHSASNVHFGDLPDVNVLDDVLSDGDDVVAGSVIGREAAGEKLAHVAELVWLKFTGTDGQVAARILLEEAKPQAVAAELGLDPAHVSAVAHKAHQERRLLERKVKENPEFRCWRLRKHMSNYYSTGEVSLALRAHWITCAKCRGAERAVQKHTHAALAPFLPGGALATAGGASLLTRLLGHAARPARAARRLLRPAGHAGAKAGASSTQVATIGASVTSKAAVIAAAAVVGTGAVGATAAVAVLHHFSHRAAPRPIVHTPPRRAVEHAPASPPASAAATPATTSTPLKSIRHVTRARHITHPRHVRRAKAAPHPASARIAVASPPVTHTTAPPPTTTAAPPVNTSPPPPLTHTAPPTSSPPSGAVSNPSYATPNAP
jgi:hypothetical protein